jgi:hypothetical protein
MIARRASPQATLRDCLFCKKPFPGRTNAKYCSPTCKDNSRGRCSITDCNKIVHSGGLCSTHYDRLKRHGDPDIVHKSRPFKNCQTCGNPFLSWGGVQKYCSKLCYKRARFPRPLRTCIVCSSRFLGWGMQNTCSPKCRKIRQNELCVNYRRRQPEHVRLARLARDRARNNQKHRERYAAERLALRTLKKLGIIDLQEFMKCL